MVIEIHRPELEALITERLMEGPFQTVTDLLLHALKMVPIENQPTKTQSSNVIEFFRKSSSGVAELGFGMNKKTESSVD